MANFSDRVKQLRRECNLSLRQLSKLTGISHSAISAYETGKREAGLESLEALCDVFNCDIDYILGRTDIKNGVANRLGYNSLAEAFNANTPCIYPLNIQLFASDEKTSPDQQELTEGERVLIEIYRRASDDVKPVLINAVKALESMPTEKARFVAELLGK